MVTSKLPSVIHMSQTMQRQRMNNNNNNEVLLGRMLGYLFFSLFSSLFARSNVPCMCPDGNDWKEMESRVNIVDSKPRFLSTSLRTPGIKTTICPSPMSFLKAHTRHWADNELSPKLYEARNSLTSQSHHAPVHTGFSPGRDSSGTGELIPEGSWCRSQRSKDYQEENAETLD